MRWYIFIFITCKLSEMQRGRFFNSPSPGDLTTPKSPALGDPRGNSPGNVCSGKLGEIPYFLHAYIPNLTSPLSSIPSHPTNLQRLIFCCWHNKCSNTLADTQPHRLVSSSLSLITTASIMSLSCTIKSGRCSFTSPSRVY